MWGAVAGDVIGSVFEAAPLRSTAFPLFAPHSRFTDDTVLTVATAAAILRSQAQAVALAVFKARRGETKDYP